MDDASYAPEIFPVHNCSDCSVKCGDMANVRKIYWKLYKGASKDVAQIFHDIMGLQWNGSFSHECNKHQTDRYIPGSCDNTLCDIMSPTPTRWFEISSTWRMTQFSYDIHERLKPKPRVPNIMSTTLKPTKLLCVYTGMIVLGETCDTYFTVSHVWSARNFAMVDGKLSRGSKGYPSLERTSKLLGVRYAWIDTCCINQDDTDEKEREISRMGDYYRNAQACVVLHSSDVRDIDNITNSMKILSADSVSFIRPAHTWALACIRYSKLLTDAWFTRIWTTQEAVLSKKLVIDSSRGLVDLEEMLQHYNIIVRQVGGIPMCDDVGTVRTLSEFISTRFIDMTTILKLCANRQATVGHDYVYGVLGMLPHVQMKVDYKAPLKQVASELYKLLIQHNDILWLSWIGPSCIDRGKQSWIPTIGSPIMFSKWNNGIIFRSNHNLMNIFCSDIRVEVLGGSTSDKIYTTNFQPIVTLCDLSCDTNKCVGCIAKIFCNYACCQPWMIVKAAIEAEQTHFIVCDECNLQSSLVRYTCCKHIFSTFHRVSGSCLWLIKSKTDDMYALVATTTSNFQTNNVEEIGKYLLYGRRVRTITKRAQNARLVLCGNFGWLILDTVERVGVIVACSKTYTMSDAFISV